MPDTTTPQIGMAMVTTATRDAVANKTLTSLEAGNPGSTAPHHLTVCRDVREGPLLNHMAAWRAVFADPDTTHGLVLHDDLIAPHGWRDVIDLFVRTLPREHVMSFYTARREATTSGSQAFGHLLLPPHDWLNEQALLLSRDVYTGYVRWLASGDYTRLVSPDQGKHHDMMLNAYLTQQRLTVVVAAPSLFQHRPGPATSIPRPGAPTETHQAHQWPGEEWDALATFTKYLTLRPLGGRIARFSGLG